MQNQFLSISQKMKLILSVSFGLFFFSCGYKHDTSKQAPLIRMQHFVSMPDSAVKVSFVVNYILDANYTIRKANVSTANFSATIKTVTGNGVAAAGGNGIDAELATISDSYGIALDTSGNIIFCETNSQRVRKIDFPLIQTVAGTEIQGSSSASIDGLLASTTPLGVSNSIVRFDNDGNLYISIGNRIAKMTPDDILHVIAETGANGTVNIPIGSVALSQYIQIVV
jgi:hypothetical protein